VAYRSPDKKKPGDAMDPIQAGCGDPKSVPILISLDSVTVYLRDGSEFGDLIMRNNPRCAASWGRVDGPVDAKHKVYVTARRPSDHKATVSWYGGKSPTAYGWMLSTEPGCVYVEAYVQTPEGNGPTARTQCL
jgi:hypothetical protein